MVLLREYRALGQAAEFRAILNGDLAGRFRLCIAVLQWLALGDQWRLPRKGGVAAEQSARMHYISHCRCHQFFVLLRCSIGHFFRVVYKGTSSGGLVLHIGVGGYGRGSGSCPGLVPSHFSSCGSPTSILSPYHVRCHV